MPSSNEHKPPRAVRLFFSAVVGSVALIIAVLVTYVITLATPSAISTLVMDLVCLCLTVYFVSWLGRRLDALWQVDRAGPVGGTLHVITDRTSFFTTLGAVVVFLIIIVTRLLFLPPDELVTPLQPILTFILACSWVGYIFYSLSRLVGVEDHKPEELASFSRNAVAGSIALSIYFLLPWAWLVNAGNRAFQRVLLGAEPHSIFVFSPDQNSTVNWLQTTAVPTIVATGFGFLTAYVTSLVWYEYYRAVSGAGLDSVSASRRGRDPKRNDYWFELLTDSQSRVTLVGATLGGWFSQWAKFRSALRALLGRETVNKVLIILPEPGGSFFWQRRTDEISRERLLSEDPITRLARAIELLYLVLPDGGAAALQLLEEHKLTDELTLLPSFNAGFTADMKEHVATYESVEPNRMFSQEVKNALEIGRSDNPQAKERSFCVKFSKGSMTGISIFDTKIAFVPYLPGVEDKDCPEFTVKSHTPLGASLERSVLAMELDSIELTERAHAVAMAFRLWQACRLKKTVLQGLSDVPAWLSKEYGA